MKLIPAFLIFTLLGCVNEVPRDENEVISSPVNQADILSISSVYARLGSLEPCDCSFLPLGGFNRESNLLAIWKQQGDLLHFSEGPTFGDKNSPEEMIQALNKLSLAASTLSVSDFWIGKKRLQHALSMANFPWVFSNLEFNSVPKNKNHKRLVLNLKGWEIRIISLASFVPLQKKPEWLKWTPPKKVLEEELSLAVNPKTLFLILSDLDEKQIREFAPLIRYYTLFIGSKDTNYNTLPDQISDKVLLVRPSPESRIMAKIDLNLKNAQDVPSHFYNDSLTPFFKSIYETRIPSETKGGALNYDYEFVMLNEKLD